MVVEVVDKVRENEGRAAKPNPFAGRPKRLGRFLPGTRHVQLVLLSGRRADVTVCGDCTLDGAGLRQLWKNVSELAALENTAEYRKAMNDTGQVHMTPAQVEKNQRMTILFQSDRPLGVLHDVPVEEVARGRTA